MNANLTVAKFGGTSMGSADAMHAAAKIVMANPDIRLVVVSATSGTTNQLLQVYNAALSAQKSAVVDQLGAIAHRHREQALALQAPSADLAALEKELAELEALPAEIHKDSPAVLDELLSFGERLSSTIFRVALSNAGANVVVRDARELLITNASHGKAEPNLHATKFACERKLAPLLEAGQMVLTQGFIGATAHGFTTTLGRGGSDFSAALFAEALEAKNVEIWTDVSGILTMDPRTVPDAKIIREISFAEAAELANFGAKVLHPATLAPAMRAKSIVFVKNTFAPEDPGTKIVAEIESEPLFRAVAVRNKQTLITVSSPRMLNAHGFLAKVFSMLAEHEVSVDLVTTSEVSVALTIDGTSLGSAGKCIQENKALFTALKSAGDVELEEELSLIALVGNHLTESPGVAARAFQALSDINVRLICHGASHNNLCFLVSSAKATEAAQRIHKEFL